MLSLTITLEWQTTPVCAGGVSFATWWVLPGEGASSRQEAKPAMSPRDGEREKKTKHRDRSPWQRGCVWYYLPLWDKTVSVGDVTPCQRQSLHMSRWVPGLSQRALQQAGFAGIPPSGIWLVSFLASRAHLAFNQRHRVITNSLFMHTNTLHYTKAHWTMSIIIIIIIIGCPCAGGNPPPQINRIKRFLKPLKTKTETLKLGNRLNCLSD